MSMSIYGLMPNQEIKELDTFNLGVGAVCLKFWMHMEQKYLPVFVQNGIKSTRFPYFKPGKSPCNEVWDLVDDKRLTPEERILMGLTFDYVFVKREDIPLICRVLSSDDANDGMHLLVPYLEKAVQEHPEVSAFAIMWQSVNDYYGCDYDDDLNEVYPTWDAKKNWYLFDDASMKECKEALEHDNT